MHPSLRFVKSEWFRIFIGGTLLFFATEQALRFTGNPAFVPIVLLLGAFVVPVAFVSFFYGQERAVDKLVHAEAPLRMAAACFLIGGVVGVVVSGFVEYATLTQLTISSLFIVGLIEEGTKLIFPIAIYVRSRYRSEADGLLFGVASGMGFAALETMGYGLVALIQAGGSVGMLEQTLLVRGLLSPVGHAAWTGLITATLWRQRERTGKLFNPRVIPVFVLAVVLHALWDIAGFSQQAFIAYAGYVIIGGISLILLIRRLREARRLAV
jgi:RsiW-degrading membrane proteinase PrsW (M82 family)